MKRAAREWARKAEDDYRLAATIGGGSQPFHDQLCFHSSRTKAARTYMPLPRLLSPNGLIR